MQTIATGIKIASALAFAYLAVHFASQLFPSQPQDLTVENLMQQVRGDKNYWTPSGEPPTAWSSSSFRNYERNCKVFALKKIGELGPDATDAVPELIELFKTGANDFDTGDGVIEYRSRIAKTLGQIGDARAIEPLLQRLAIRETVDNAGSRYNKEGFDHQAVIYALMAFGNEATQAHALIESCYEQRKTDPNYDSDAKSAMAMAIDFYRDGIRNQKEFLRFTLPLYLDR